MVVSKVANAATTSTSSAGAGYGTICATALMVDSTPCITDARPVLTAAEKTAGDDN